MRFLSWNVNGLRACVKKGFGDVFRELDADFLVLGRLFPREAGFSLSALRWTISAEAEIERSYDVEGGPALRGEGESA